MLIQKCSSSIKQLNSPTTNTKPGKQLAALEQEMACLSAFEKNIKQRMQDRMKFMSCKNALRLDAELAQIDKRLTDVRQKISDLQEDKRCFSLVNRPSGKKKE